MQELLITPKVKRKRERTCQDTGMKHCVRWRSVLSQTPTTTTIKETEETIFQE